MLVVVDGFDYKPVVAREIEKGARFSWAAELGENVLGGEGEEVIGGIESEVVLSKLTKDPWRVVFELEIIFGRGCQLVTNTGETLARWNHPKAGHTHVKRKLVPGSKVIIRKWSLNLGLTTRDANADAGQHVVHQYIVNMIFADQIADEDFFFIYGRLLVVCPSQCGFRLLLRPGTFAEALSANLVRLFEYIRVEWAGENNIRLSGHVSVRTSKWSG